MANVLQFWWHFCLRMLGSLDGLPIMILVPRRCDHPSSNLQGFLVARLHVKGVGWHYCKVRL